MDLPECVGKMSLIDTKINLEAEAAIANQKSKFTSEDKSCGVLINGIHTDIVIKNYRNRTFLIVTQFKKFGSIITVLREEAANSYVYTIKTILGKDDSDTHVAARYIAEQIAIEKPLLLSICLKDYGVDTLKQVVAAINKIKSL